MTYETLASKIVDADSRIYSCLIVSNPSAATLAEATKPEMRNNLGSLSKRTGGMVGQWMILAFKAMTRLDGVRTKAQYLVVGREKFNALIFPLESGTEALIGITFDPESNPREIFAVLSGMTKDNARLVST
jgi:hypothetical protein